MPSLTPSRNPGGRSAAETMRVLVIDDDRELCALLATYLEPFGYQIVAEHDGASGVERALAEKFHAIILDVMLPGVDGFEALRRVRTRSRTPVLMLTSRGDETDRIVGLEMGADDYLPKTFSPRELLARLRAVARRSAAGTGPEAAPAPEIVVGALRINPAARLAILDEQPLTLTAVEFELLLALANARGRVKTREQLIETIAERDYNGFDRSIDVHIWALRRKLGDDPKSPRFIKTVRAMGYMLIAE